MDATPNASILPPPLHTSVAVLVVDDDEYIRDTLSEFLREEGYDVSLASDGASALRQVRDHPHGIVVLLDLNMPGMDGEQVLQTVMADVPLAQQRYAFIMMTAYTPSVGLPRALTTLLTHLQVPIIAKPFDLAQIAETVAQAAQQLVERNKTNKKLQAP